MWESSGGSQWLVAVGSPIAENGRPQTPAANRGRNHCIAITWEWSALDGDSLPFILPFHFNSSHISLLPSFHIFISFFLPYFPFSFSFPFFSPPFFLSLSFPNNYPPHLRLCFWWLRLLAGKAQAPMECSLMSYRIRLSRKSDGVWFLVTMYEANTHPDSCPQTRAMVYLLHSFLGKIHSTAQLVFGLVGAVCLLCAKETLHVFFLKLNYR